ncbi:hypothetical protein DERF_008778 [Dermatophagoides farinae]|uniref:Uncharacterized protein n=1 Tax=Dermatophagoides farinae TaxID=6954 RepID=A0A922I449_DERFA|nr:hypothetical protein DERF_008778 [Dermatophagoides farinae]
MVKSFCRYFPIMSQSSYKIQYHDLFGSVKDYNRMLDRPKFTLYVRPYTATRKNDTLMKN